MKLDDLLDMSKSKRVKKDLTLDELKAIVIVWGDGNYSKTKLLRKIKVGEQRANKIYDYVEENKCDLEKELDKINNL